MGNAMKCFVPERDSDHHQISGSTGKRTGLLSAFSSSKKKENLDDAIIREQAVAAAMLFQEFQRTGSLPFNRSTSVRDVPSGSKKQNIPRSLSTRPQSNNYSILQPQQLVNQDVRKDELDTTHFVLVHGGGFGAWCWYKIITLLRESGFKVDAVDLAGAGVNSIDTNSISSLEQYAKPLTSMLQKLGDMDKVILVGHDLGGVCISYAMEMFPCRVAKAVYIAAVMLKDGENALDMISEQMGSNDMMQRAYMPLYGDGNNQSPTAIDVDKAILKDIFFNRSPSKDAVLASVSMRAIPYAPIQEKLSLSDKNYSSVRRFYVKTLDDSALSIQTQETMIESNPPEQVFQIKGSDHAPFFSKPQALHRILLEISKIPTKHV